MPISRRARALREALERALGTPVHLLVIDQCTRVHTVAPPGDDRPAWTAALGVLRSADRWGSSTATGDPEIWAEVDDEVSP